MLFERLSYRLVAIGGCSQTLLNLKIKHKAQIKKEKEKKIGKSGKKNEEEDGLMDQTAA